MKRVALMIPSNNAVVEPEYWSLGLKGVTFHSDRLVAVGESKKGLLKMLRGSAASARVLAGVSPDVIALCCLSSSLVGGLGWDRKLGRRISVHAGGVPTVTAASAMIDGLKRLGLKSVATFSGYRPDVDKMLREFLVSNGIEVTSSIGLGLGLKEVGNFSQEEAYRKIVAMPLRGAEGVFIGSTDLGVLSIIERLEQAIGTPVMSVNQAVLKSVLEVIGMEARLEGFGLLLGGT